MTENNEKKLSVTDRPTDGPNNRLTDRLKKKERNDVYWGLQSTTDERYTVVHTMNVD